MKEKLENILFSLFQEGKGLKNPYEYLTIPNVFSNPPIQLEYRSSGKLQFLSGVFSKNLKSMSAESLMNYRRKSEKKEKKE